MFTWPVHTLIVESRDTEKGYAKDFVEVPSSPSVEVRTTIADSTDVTEGDAEGSVEVPIGGERSPASDVADSANMEKDEFEDFVVAPITLGVEDKTRHWQYINRAPSPDSVMHHTDIGGATVAVRQKIYNGRLDKFRSDLTLDACSFELVQNCKTSLTNEDFYDMAPGRFAARPDAMIDGGLGKLYYDEMVEFVMKQLRCDKVVCFDHKVRNEETQGEANTEGYAVGEPHTDSSAISADELCLKVLRRLAAEENGAARAGEQKKERADDSYSEAELADYSDSDTASTDADQSESQSTSSFPAGTETEDEPKAKSKFKRYAYVNLWRNISDEPIADNHLAMMDERTAVKPDDYIPKDVFGPGWSVRQYCLNARHARSHKWFYFPGMTKDEAILLKVFDSDWTKPGRICFHTAMPKMLGADEDAPPRESIELRMICFWKDAEVDSMPTAQNTHIHMVKDLEKLAKVPGRSRRR